MTDWYSVFVQPKIDAIVRDGDIADLIFNVASTFNGVASRYIGSDERPHEIIYESITLPNVVQRGDRGFLPVSTLNSATSTFDVTQEGYSMKPLIEYLRAYYKLASHISSRNRGVYQPLQYAIYDKYIKAYNNLRNFFSYFTGYPKNFNNTPLFQFCSDPALMSESLNAIFDQLFVSRTFSCFVSGFKRDYSKTVYYETGANSVGLYNQSRDLAYVARFGLRPTRIP
jgi:hypothetical protein